jgi:3-methyladenine DNA glycosylase AlkC
MEYSLKENLFSRPMVGAMAAALAEAYPSFHKDRFRATVLDEQWEQRPLMDRMRHVAALLRDFLPADYGAALAVLEQVIESGKLPGFTVLAPAEFVARYGLDDVEASLAALERFTQAGSAEFAIRPFILRYPERTMAQMLAWASHPEESVRRLASEGCRPRLPWGVSLPAFKRDPSPILPVLERLRHDSSENVRRSVANNLNDIGKDNPAVTLATVRRWLAEGETPALRALVTHALRTLVKAGNAEALALLGFDSQAMVKLTGLRVEPEVVKPAGQITFSFAITSTADRPQELVIDYVLHMARASGRSSAKVFKHSQRRLGPGETIQIIGRRNFRPLSTRRYYPGRHAIQPKVNGQLYDMVEFELLGD